MRLAEQLIDFAESGNQQKISLANGQVLQGWIMEINEDALLLSTGYCDKAGKDHWLPLHDIQQASLEYWDTQLNLWRVFNLQQT